MRLIDTHCHLAHGRLRQQTAEVLARAAEAGLVACICAAADLAETKAAIGLAEAHENVFHTAGIHPHDAKDANEAALAQIEQLAARDKCVAVGEIGLDYHYDFSPRDDQQRAFAAQLELAKRIGKPIVIHTREAFDDTLAILAEANVGDQTVIFHSFTDGAAAVRRLLDIGAVVSYSGIATFKTAGDLREGALLVPDDRILIETDAPFLSPEPVRKMKTNEPANVAHVAAGLATTRGVDAEAFAEQTTANTISIFSLDSLRESS
jgi:TatD DNase family protein